MSDVLISSLIGVSGAVLVAICGVIAQVILTRKVIHAEREKVLMQIEREDLLRRNSKRQDQLLESLSELIAVADPENTKQLDVERPGSLIASLQLLLDRSDTDEKRLNRALNILGLALRDFSSEPEVNKLETRNLLQLHFHVIDLGAVVIRRLTNSSIESQA